jgi:hypothetical protein
MGEALSAVSVVLVVGRSIHFADNEEKKPWGVLCEKKKTKKKLRLKRLISEGR